MTDTPIFQQTLRDHYGQLARTIVRQGLRLVDSRPVLRVVDGEEDQ